MAAFVAVAHCAEMDATPAMVNLNFYQAGGAGISGGVQQGDSLVDRLGINNEAFFNSQVDDVTEPPRRPGTGVPKPGVELVAGEDGSLSFEGDQGLADRVQDLADKQGPSFGTINFYQAGGPGVSGAEESLDDRMKPPSMDDDSINRDSQIFDWVHDDGLEWSWQYE